MSEYFVLHSNYFVYAGLVVSAFIIPVGLFIARSLMKEITNQSILKMCGSIGVITLVGTALMGLGMHLGSLENTPAKDFEFNFSALLAIAICPGTFAIISSVAIAVAIWSYRLYRLDAKEKTKEKAH